MSPNPPIINQVNIPRITQFLHFGGRLARVESSISGVLSVPVGTVDDRSVLTPSGTLSSSESRSKFWQIEIVNWWLVQEDAIENENYGIAVLISRFILGLRVQVRPSFGSWFPDSLPQFGRRFRRSWLAHFIYCTLPFDTWLKFRLWNKIKLRIFYKKKEGGEKARRVHYTITNPVKASIDWVAAKQKPLSAWTVMPSAFGTEKLEVKIKHNEKILVV